MDQTASTTEQQQPPPQPPPENTQPPPTSTVAQPTTPIPSSNPNPTSNTTPTPTLRPPITPQPQTRPPFTARPWQQPPPSHFSLPSPPLPSSPATTTAGSINPRGGMAIGVPAHHPTSAPSPPASFSSLAPPSYGTQQTQIRPPMQGIGMTGTLGTTTSMRPGGIPGHQLRPSQSALRPQSSPSSQSPASQSFQGHGMLRVSTMGSPVSPSPSSSQNQPWLSSASQGKPPLPTPSLRPQTSPQSFQQRSHIPQQHQHNMSTTTQPPMSITQQLAQAAASGQQQDHGQHFPPNRTQPPLSHQQQITRAPGSGTQRPPISITSSAALQAGIPNKTTTAENEESSNRIVTKRSIQELLNQIDPSEKFGPEVEDILVDIAEEFVDSITTFGCSLAKHRKSSTLEAKDILLHLERNWNMTIPGFGGDEIKTYKKPVVSDIHRERIAAIKRATVAPDMTTKSSGGPSGGNAKGHLAKGPATTIN